MIPHPLIRAPILDRESFLVEASRGKSVLHLGCADAPYSQCRATAGTLLHARLAAVTKEIVGIDIDADGIKFLLNLGFKDVFLGNVETLSDLTLGRTFDVVVAGELLEHLANPGLCLTSVRGLLRMDGSLLITVPNAFSLKGFMRVIRGVELIHPDHVSYFSTVTVRRLLESCGYSMVSHAYYVSRSVSRLKQAADMLALGPIRRFAPYLSDGLIVEAKLVQ